MKELLAVAACEDNEGTAFPWWGICCGSKTEPRLLNGPFFSRNSAFEYLENHHYRYKKGFVYCFSGHGSPEFRNLYNRSKSLQPPKLDEEEMWSYPKNRI